MPRPPKCRRVGFMPGVTYFKPAGVPLRALEEVVLSVEEAEALRLKDLERLEQEQGADKMNISRPTFQRVLISARQKIADAVLNGKAIRIGGGNFEMASVHFRCATGHEWGVPFDITLSDPPQYCPVCNTTNIAPLQAPGSGSASRRGRGRSRGWRAH
jgi:predicted DNA-binding protein (UPF0251 family)